MKSKEYIGSLLKSENFKPKPYSHADWFCNYLNQVLGFYWEDDTPPHFKLRAGSLIVTVSPYPNIVIVDVHEKVIVTEKYFHPSIPQNQDEFNQFWEKIKPLI